MTHQTLAQNPQTAEFVMAAQNGKLSQHSASEPPKLTKAKTLQVFETSQELTVEAMKRIQATSLPGETGGDQASTALSMMVEQAKMQDEMFLKTGVENEEFEEALLYFVSKDEDVKRAMSQYMTKIQEQMP